MSLSVAGLCDDEATCAECGGGVTWVLNAEGFAVTFCRTHLLSTAEKMKRAVRERDAWLKKYYAGKVPAFAKEG